MAKTFKYDKSKRERDKRLYMALRKEVIEAYGGACTCCGENIFEFLQIDHIAGTGVKAKDRNKHPKTAGGGWLYGWLKRNHWPDGFTVLCANCNYVKRFGATCPHKSFDLRHGLKFIA
jgi:hypothetical protein